VNMTDLKLQPLYELRGVSRHYGDGAREVRAVDSVDLRIDPGEFVVVAGASGSGKTTLLQLLGALDRPTEGEILFEGRDLARVPDAELTQLRLDTIGFVFQQFNLIPTLTARQNVEVALAPRGLATSEREQTADELLESVGLGQRGRHLPSELSGGEQQRVAIARALANRPRVLLADEPTGNLDSGTGDEIVGILKSLSERRSQTVVLITHDAQIAARARRVVRMQDGRVLQARDPRELTGAAPT
jgi:putative ABC transport system ATP-binding protein